MGHRGAGAVCPRGSAEALSAWNPITESQSWEGAGQITRSNPFMLQMRKPRWSALPKVPVKSEQKWSWGPGLPALASGLPPLGNGDLLLPDLVFCSFVEISLGNGIRKEL